MEKKDSPENWAKDGTGESIIKHPGSLTKFGYHLEEPDKVREKALREAVKAYGIKAVRLKIAALIGFNKHTRFNGIPSEDMEYLNRYAKRMKLAPDSGPKRERKRYTLMTSPLVVSGRRRR